MHFDFKGKIKFQMRKNYQFSGKVFKINARNTMIELSIKQFEHNVTLTFVYKLTTNSLKLKIMFPYFLLYTHARKQEK